MSGGYTSMAHTAAGSVATLVGRGSICNSPSLPMCLPRAWNGVRLRRWTLFLSTFAADRPPARFYGVLPAKVNCKTRWSEAI